MKAAPTASRAWMAAILDAAARQGVPREAIARATGVPVAVLDAPRCPLPVCVATWDAAATLSGDPLFGLHAGVLLRPLHLNLLTHAMAGSGTVGEALARARRYLPLVSDGGTIEPQLHGAHLEICYLPLSHGLRYSHHQIDAALLAVRTGLLWLLGDAGQPLRATLRHPLAQPAAYRAAFGCPVRGNATRDALLYPTSLLAVRTGADRVSAARETARADRLLATLRESSWTARCERLLAAALAHGEVTREAMAARLSVSPRTLQRRLAAEGHDFQALLANLRRDLACEYLESGLSPSETARLLGYSEQAAFHRAFVGWLGVTPGAYARRAAAPLTPAAT